jgi:hypothetical protein
MLTLALSATISTSIFCGRDRQLDAVKSQPLPASISRPDPPPEYLKPFTDSKIGSTIVRISDRSAFGSDRQELRHVYAKNQPWNADESYSILNSKYPAALLDGRTYQFIRWVRQPSQSVWSSTNPSLMYGMTADTNEFVQLDIANGDRRTVLHKFREYDVINFGEWEGNLSNNDRYVALFGLKAGKVDFLVYDLRDDRVVSRKTQPIGTTLGGAKATINNITMSQSGRYVVVQYNQRGTGVNRGVRLFDRSLNFVRQLATRGGSHFDTCIDSTGSESIVIQDNDSSAIVSVRYSNGKKTTVLPANRLTYNIHISCRNLRRPGWAYISDFSVPPTSGTPTTAKVINNQTFALKLDSSGTMQQFASLNYSPNQAYERQPQSVPNQDGTKVLFASDWGDRSGPVYTYVARRGN